MAQGPMDLQVDEPRRDGTAVYVHDLLPLPGFGAKGQYLGDPVPFKTQVPIDKVAVQQQLPVLNEHVPLPSRAHTIPFPRRRGRLKGRYSSIYILGSEHPFVKLYFSPVCRFTP